MNFLCAVFTSSIAVFGAPLPSRIDDETPQLPTLSYGAQKKSVEVLLADYSRRGWIDGLSLRLSGIVARPSRPGAALSAFASDLIGEPSKGRAYVCPVGPDATVLFLSLPACIENLLHAARLLLDRTGGAAAAVPGLPRSRAITLPALRASAAEVVDALARRHGEAVRELVTFRPDPTLRGQFGCWPPFFTAEADRLGFRHDGDLDTLLERALKAT